MKFVLSFVLLCLPAICSARLHEAGRRNEKLQNRSLAEGTITTFELYNADGDKFLFNLVDGSVIDLQALGITNYNALHVVATTSGEVGSVRFALDGDTNYRIENVPPYALCGDISGDFLPCGIYKDGLAVGDHTITATIYSRGSGSGTAGNSASITVSVVASSGPKTDAPAEASSTTNAPTKSPSPAPTKAPSTSPATSKAPSAAPTEAPSASPAPSKAPSAAPSKAPSAAPTKAPSASPAPSKAPSAAPTKAPSASSDALQFKLMDGTKTIVTDLTTGDVVNLAAVGVTASTDLSIDFIVDGITNIQEIKFDVDGTYYRKESAALYALCGNNGDELKPCPILTLGTHSVKATVVVSGTDVASKTVTFTTTESAVPTKSPAPSMSPAPSQAPTISNAPTTAEKCGLPEVRIYAKAHDW
jgi:hypothetical protein